MDPVRTLVTTLEDLRQAEETRAAWHSGRCVPDGVRANAKVEAFTRAIELTTELLVPREGR